MSHTLRCRFDRLWSGARQRQSCRAGVSLIEVLVTISIIAILIGILVPSLSGVRRQARHSVALSNLRQTAAWFSIYTEQYGGVLPYAPPGATFALSAPEDADATFITPGYWDLSFYWPSLFHQVAPWQANFHLWVIPDGQRDPRRPWVRATIQGQPSFAYSRALFARPQIWDPDGSIVLPVDVERVLRPVRLTEVRHTADKVLLFDFEAPWRVGPNRSADEIDHRLMNFVDGHAVIKRISKSRDPVRMRLPDPPEPIRLHDTANGALGLDY